MSSEKVKLFIVTYKRMSALHTTLKQIFDTTDFMKVYPNTEVVVINNHTNFKLDDYFVNKGVKVLHNDCRPDWSCGNLGRNWNEALLHGFKDLNNPDADIVIAAEPSYVVSESLKIIPEPAVKAFGTFLTSNAPSLL